MILPLRQSALPTADFTFEISRIWLMSSSKVSPCRLIDRALSLTSAASLACRSLLNPSIKVSGVRNSWVILVKNCSRRAESFLKAKKFLLRILLVYIPTLTMSNNTAINAMAPKRMTRFSNRSCSCLWVSSSVLYFTLY